jgi:Zn-dependent peptidase ImmA (M78 family)
MPLAWQENSLQMEWCLDCHRNPAKNLRPTSQVYNMAWEKPASDRPVWCSVADSKSGTPTAEGVNCVTKDPSANPETLASLAPPVLMKTAAQIGDTDKGMMALNQASPAVNYQKFTSQDELGHFLVDHYKIRTPKDLTSCEVCHR